MSEWIRIDDRLPDIEVFGGRFDGLVSDGRSVIPAFYWCRRHNAITGESEFIWTAEQGSNRDISYQITHWMPLPDPPAPSQPTGEPSAQE